MAFKKHTPKRLIIRVSDIVIDGTRVGQETEVMGFSIQRDPYTLACSIDVNLLIRPRSIKEDGTLGDEINKMLFRTYTRPMNGANDTLVAVNTGAVLLIKGRLTEQQWFDQITALTAKLEEEKGGDTALQGDWFEDMMAAGPVDIYPLLRHFVEMADAQGFFQQ